MKKFWHERIQPNQKPILLGLFLILTVFRVALFLRTPLAVSADAAGDDWNLLNHAWQMQNGNWLGAYQDATLSYGVAFPLFVMLCHKLCIPFMMGTALLYIGSILYFLYAWKVLIPSPLIRGSLYLFFLYSPVMMTVSTAQRAWDLTLVPSLIFLLLAFGFRIYEKRRNHLTAFTLAFSVVFTFFWYLRKTSHWILPLLAGFLVFLGRQLKKDKCGRKMLVLLLPFLMVIGAGTGIALMNSHYYQQFRIYDTRENESTASAPFRNLVRDTALTVFHMASNQMTTVDTYPSSGDPEKLRFVESLTGSQVIYPSDTPLQLTGWAFPADESSNLELAVTDIDGNPLVYAELENSEDIYMANPDYSASRVSRFHLNVPTSDLRHVFLTVYLDGSELANYPMKPVTVENEIYHLSLESAEVHEDPALDAARKAVKVSKIIFFLYKILGIPLLILTVISYIGISFSLKSGNKIFQRWIFLTGIGLTALYSVILNCAASPSLAGLDPGAYSSGAWTFIQILMTLCIAWFVKPLKLGKKHSKK